MKVNPNPLMHHSDAAWQVLDERKRQINSEGWDTSHDDEHESRELARAALAYLTHYVQRSVFYDEDPGDYEDEEDIPETWPWLPNWWKPKNPRRDLVRAAALIIAEIERLDRASSHSSGGEKHG